MNSVPASLKPTSKIASAGFGTQIRRSPFFAATEKWGAAGYSVYNHMYIPRDFGDPVENFWNLTRTAILCDVAVERQVEVTGPDAARFVQYMTPRNLKNMAVGQAKYILITDQHGGIINDPVLLKLADDHFWISIGDSDVLLWARGLAANPGMDVTIREPDVSPLQLQGPNSREIIRRVFGDAIAELKYYWFAETELDAIPLVVSRTGWSSELGYEIFLRDGSRGTELWEIIMTAGADYDLRPGHTSSIRRIEGGMLSYHADMDIETNPFELRLDRLVDLEMDADFVGKAALRQIKAKGVGRIQIGIVIEGDPLTSPNNEFWPLSVDGRQVGKVTSAIYSPRLEKNIALCMIETGVSEIGQQVEVMMSDQDQQRRATIVPIPFHDPKKSIAAG